jgi:rhodanese-related sulfurtransferase
MGCESITTLDLQKRLERGETINLIDVRDPDEWNRGHIAQATLVPLGTLAAKSGEMDPDEEFVLICQSGARSSRACDMLVNKGFTRVVNVKGGMSAWQGPVVK